MENNKKKLKIAFADEKVDNSIVDYLKTFYDIEILKNPMLLAGKKGIIPDLIIFSGGEDVTPSFYNEQYQSKYTSCNFDRDVKEKYFYDFFRQYNHKIPKLGICRGAQFLTVLNGGKLIQHVNNHKNSNHSIETIYGTIINIPSDHHQMMFPYILKENSYQLIGYSERYLSNIYFNGQDKNIELPSNFLEPEIVYYNNTNSLCIQSHPEWAINSKDSNYLLKIIDKLLFNNKKNSFDEDYYIEKNSFDNHLKETIKGVSSDSVFNEIKQKYHVKKFFNEE